MVSILALLAVSTTGSQVKPLEFRCGLLSPAGSGDGITLIAFVTSMVVITDAPWHPKMQLVIRSIFAYPDVSVNASNLGLLKCHLGSKIVMKNRIFSTHYCYRGAHSQ